MENTLLNLNQLIALFLAEAIRSRRTSLARAAEISGRVIANLPLIKSESQALNMVTEIEKDFQEVSALKHALHFGYKPTDVKVYEEEIKAYASKILVQDMNVSNNFLQDAAQTDMTIQKLCLKHPDFCEYLSKFSTLAQNLKVK
jgi:hypothetical protein